MVQTEMDKYHLGVKHTFTGNLLHPLGNYPVLGNPEQRQLGARIGCGVYSLPPRSIRLVRPPTITDTTKKRL